MQYSFISPPFTPSSLCACLHCYLISSVKGTRSPPFPPLPPQYTRHCDELVNISFHAVASPITWYTATLFRSLYTLYMYKSSVFPLLITPYRRFKKFQPTSYTSFVIPPPPLIIFPVLLVFLSFFHIKILFLGISFFFSFQNYLSPFSSLRLLKKKNCSTNQIQWFTLGAVPGSLTYVCYFNSSTYTLWQKLSLIIYKDGERGGGGINIHVSTCSRNLYSPVFLIRTVPSRRDLWKLYSRR